MKRSMKIITAVISTFGIAGGAVAYGKYQWGNPKTKAKSIVSTVTEDIDMDSDRNEKRIAQADQMVQTGNVATQPYQHAIRHVPATDATPVITAFFQRHTLHFAVRDFGEGIGAGHIRHVTKPWYRADVSPARPTDGSWPPIASLSAHCPSAPRKNCYHKGTRRRQYHNRGTAAGR